MAKDRAKDKSGQNADPESGSARGKAGNSRSADTNASGGNASADKTKRDSRGIERAVEDFTGQLRGFAERGVGLVGGALPSGIELPTPPGALSAGQIRAIARAVEAQRTQITAVNQQLTALDEQLAVLEKLLRPLEEWSATWAHLEESVTGLIRQPLGGEKKDKDGTNDKK